MGNRHGPGIAPENPFVSLASYLQFNQRTLTWEDVSCKILFMSPIRPLFTTVSRYRGGDGPRFPESGR